MAGTWSHARLPLQRLWREPNVAHPFDPDLGEHMGRDNLEVAEPASSRHALDQPVSLRDLHRCLDRFYRVPNKGQARFLLHFLAGILTFLSKVLPSAGDIGDNLYFLSSSPDISEINLLSKVTK